MSPAEVREHLGPPRFVARQVIYHAYLEQWTYGGDRPWRVEFLHRRGQPPRVQSVRPPTNRNP